MIKFCGFPPEFPYQVGSYSEINVLMTKGYTGVGTSYNKTVVFNTVRAHI